MLASHIGLMSRLLILSIVLLGFLVVEAPASVDHPDAGDRLAAAALERTRIRVTYDGSYKQISYPGGDVAPDRGVCTDVVIRSYRALGIDLQKLVHEDMVSDFAAYPDRWSLEKPDANIDHRRVPNLRRFFERQGADVVVLQDGATYQPGDLVTWELGSFMPHIGIVVDRVGPSGNPMIVHNIGAGPKLEDRLFDYEITGHYRYLPG